LGIFDALTLKSVASVTKQFIGIYGRTRLKAAIYGNALDKYQNADGSATRHMIAEAG
jgi:hypothetical protein